MEGLFEDVRYGARLLLKRPGFSAIVVLTLALGIGANTALFSLVDAFLLRSLPVKDPQQLVFVHRSMPDGTSGNDFAHRTFEQFRDSSESFSGMFARDNTRVSVTVDGQPEMVWADFVSGSYFDVLGVSAAVGRIFTAGDDQAGKPPVAVISNAYWERQFARNQSAVGSTIYIGKLPFTIIGVTSPNFFGLNVAGSPAEVVLPMTIQPRLALRDHNTFEVMGRLKPGVEPGQARADLDAIYQQVLASTADAETSLQEDSEPRTQRIELKPGQKGHSDLSSDDVSELYILWAVVGAVLLIASVNVANLLLARASARQKEIAVRMALGASRSRLIRQLLTESVLLALLGGAVGLLFEAWVVDGLLKLLFSGQGPVSFDPTPDASVLVFTGTVSLVTGILFGMAPALGATRVDLTPILKGTEDVTLTRLPGRWLMKSLVVSQVALSSVLLIGAGLLIRSLGQLHMADTGYERDKVLTMWAFPALIGYDHAKEMRLYSDLLEKMGAIPGVQQASLCRYSLTINNRNPVGSRFFETMGIQLLQGREFSTADTETTSKVAIISDSVARRFFPSESPLGQRLPENFVSELGRGIQIVGVVRDTRHRLRQQGWDESVYVPYTQVPPRNLGQIKLFVRAAGNPVTIVPALRQAIKTVDQDLPLVGIQTQSQELEGFLSDQRSLATLLSIFGALALILAAIGLYGTISYGVERRTKEIGIRLALGAQKRDVLWMVLRETLSLVVIGMVLGVPIALGAGRLLSSLLFGVGTNDPFTIALAVLVMSMIASTAGYVPARRATKVDPMDALRYE
jgi:predicted permease